MRLLSGLRVCLRVPGPVLADHQAYAILFRLVQREASMVALVRVFQYLGILVLILIPLIALTKRPPKVSLRSPSHTEGN